jgi:hypothetical protein
VDINETKENGPDGNQGPARELDKTKIHDTELSNQGSPPRTYFKTTSGKFEFIPAWSITKNPPKSNWLIKSYIESDSLSLICGIPGCFKTFLALDIGLSIASGIDWHGLSVINHGPVFYIAGEGASGLSRRLRALEIKHKVDLDSIPFFVSNQAADLLDEDNARSVASAVDSLTKQYEPPALVIIDTLNRCFGSGDENNTKDMTSFINIVDSYIRSPYHCAVLIVHHTGHEGKRARGSSALKGALDWEYFLKKANGTATLSNTKVKDHEAPPDITFKSEPVTLDGWIDDDNVEMTSCVLQRVDVPAKKDKSRSMTQPVQVCLQALTNLIQQNRGNTFGASEDDWKQAAYKAGISKAQTLEANKKAFSRAKEWLEENKYVEYKNGLYQLTEDTGQEQDKIGTCPGRIPS